MKKYRLPKLFATQWVEALRSGEYKQTTLVLCDNYGYCCLGVACKVVDVPQSYIEAHNKDCISDFGFFNYGIPKELTLDLHKEFTVMNDELHKSFSEIADWIEQNVEFI